ncbi:MAG: putative phosphomethylpyrimidine kinase [Proteobacteria bacterium]|nr:putative phosphomethylpyrimidine kinase [Pseudomonadota bacterium]
MQADIEVLTSLRCHPCTVITALTTQDTRDVGRVLPQRKEDFLEQARWVLADMPVAAVKIGLLGSSEIAEAVAGLLRELPALPVVLDPVLAAGGGRELAREDLIAAIRSELLPLTAVLTPNIPEARTLAGGLENIFDCAEALRQLGCRHVLITGTHDGQSGRVVNRLYGSEGSETWEWERLPHSYHGSGCTLAAALAGFLALGKDMRVAAELAQRYTWEALRDGWALGHGQHLPNRQRRHD